MDHDYPGGSIQRTRECNEGVVVLLFDGSSLSRILTTYVSVSPSKSSTSDDRSLGHAPPRILRILGLPCAVSPLRHVKPSVPALRPLIDTELNSRRRLLQNQKLGTFL